MVSMMKNEPTTQELVNLVEFLSQRLQKLDQFEPLCLSNREKEVIAFCDQNRNYTEILNLASLRNEIVSKIENFITESNLTDEEVYDVIAKIVETVNELGPI